MDTNIHQLCSIKRTCLVTLFDRKLQIFKNSPKWTILGIFNELLSTQKVNVARFARNVEWVAERFFEKFYFVYLVVMSLSACIFVRADGSGHDRAAATASNRRLCAKFLPSGALKSPCHVHMTPPSCWNAQFWRKKYYLQSFFKVSFKTSILLSEGLLSGQFPTPIDTSPISWPTFAFRYQVADQPSFKLKLFSRPPTY